MAKAIPFRNRSMIDIQPGSWYRLIGGERIRVVSVDGDAGIATVDNGDGETRRLAHSAFVGAELAADAPEPDAAPQGSPNEWSGTLQGERDEPAARDVEDAVAASADRSDTLGDADPSPNELQENAMQDAQNADRDGMVSPGAKGAEPAGETVRPAPENARRPVPDSDASAGDLPPGETRAFDFDEPDEEGETGHALGLSPLALGMLLGMLLLAGIAGWFVLQSRLDNLEVQFEQLDERLQVVLGDTRRQGEALRTYLASPGSPRPAVAEPDKASAPAASGSVATLERQLATQAERMAALERRLVNQDAALAELDRRAGQLEKRPVPTTTTPRVSTPPAPKREVETTPIDPPAGYVVVLASLPVREQALQELDNLRAKGLSVVLREARIKNATWYRIQAEGFRDRDSATAFARTAESRHGVAGAWVVAP